MLAGHKYKTLLLHTIGWVIFVSFVGLLFYTQNSNIPTTILIKIVFGIGVFYLNYFLLMPKLLFKRRFGIYAVSVIALILVITFLYTTIKHTYFEADFIKKTPNYLFTGYLFTIPVIFSVLLKFFNQWNKNEKQKLEVTSKKVSTELQNLKNQINPHFLFNTLNSIYSLTLQNSVNAPDAVMMLSDLMRYMLYETDTDFVPLEKEIEYIENYIDLQKLQIANSDNIKLNVHGDLLAKKISPLILISFIENAFKYATDFSGKTKIDIDIYVKNDELQFKCQNIIGNRTEASNKEYGGIGIKNTKERLKFTYPEKHWLFIEEKDHKYIVNLTLKLI